MNKKVKNAKANELDGVKFKSKLEQSVFRYLKDKGYEFSYEIDKIILQQSFKPTTLFLKKNKKKEFIEDQTTIRAITYTPDFLVKVNNIDLYIEVKGFKTDSYNIKVKLFRKWLEGKDNIVFAEVTTLKEVEQALDYCKEL